MITKRIIPCLDVRDGRVVKGTSFVDIRDAGDPVALAKAYERQGADELVFLDITASTEGRDIFLEVVRQVAKEVFIPFTVGGGIRSVHNMRQLLLAGADKVAFNTAALDRPELINEGAAAFGSQCIVVAMDVKRMKSSWSVYSHGGSRAAGRDALAWACEVQRRGAGEIIATSIDRDGTQAGYDLCLLQALDQRLKIPIIASGGMGGWTDVRDALQQCRADAALMASSLHSGSTTVRELKSLLKQSNINVRM